MSHNVLNVFAQRSVCVAQLRLTTVYVLALHVKLPEQFIVEPAVSVTVTAQLQRSNEVQFKTADALFIVSVLV